MPSVTAVVRTDSASRLENVLSSVDRKVLRAPRPDWAPLVNWSGASRMPIHRWFRYREGFSPELITALALGDAILDPFCGSGSILIGAAQQGRVAVGMDVNPLAAFVARVKMTPLSDDEVTSAGRFLDELDGSVGSAALWPQPALRISDKVFEPDVLDTVLRIRTLLEEHDGRLRNFLFLAWLAILQDVGSYFKEGNGIKYRNRKRLKTGYVSRPEGQWQLERFGSDQQLFALTIFKAKLSQMVSDVVAWRGCKWAAQSVLEGNSLDEAQKLPPSSIDSVIFSPPYANRFDYFESQKVELWFGGFVKSYDDMIALRKRSVRSHLGAALDAQPSLIPEVEALIDLIDPQSYAVRMRVPALIRGYFDDMASILRSCRRVLRPGGGCYVVVGNSAYGGVIIPTDSFIAHLGIAAGFSRAVVVPVRHLTVAPQQRNELLGLESYMRESIVMLS